MKQKMDSQIVINDASLEEEKDIRYILEHSIHGTIFHTSDWNKLVSKEFEVPYRTLIARDGKKLLGMYTFFIVRNKPINHIESPLLKYGEIPYGGPIVIDQNAVKSKKIIDELLKKGTEKLIECSQIRTPPAYSIGWLKKAGYKCKKLFTPIVELERTEKDLWERMNSKRRNLVRKAISNKLQVVTPSSGFIDAYYPMLLEVFGKSGKLLPPKSYYHRVIRELTSKGWIKPFLVLHQDKPIAGAIFLCFKDTVYYWSGASFIEYRNLAPNDLIQWEIIQWARANQYKYYDLVMIEREQLPGIAHFKLGFGGELVPIYEAIKRTPLGNLTRCIKALSNPRKAIRRVKKF